MSPNLEHPFDPAVVVTVGLLVIAAADRDTPYLVVAVGLMLLASGMGLLMPPTTYAILDSLPPGKAGVGSAVNDTTREVGGSLGIALLGSLLATGYRSALGGAAEDLPEPAREAARSSIGEALHVAAQLPPDVGLPLAEAARDSFDRGMTWAMVGAAAFCVLTAGAVARFYPRTPPRAETVSAPDPATRG